MDRRKFLGSVGIISIAGAATNIAKVSETISNKIKRSENTMAKFELPNLPYEFNALEPYIDARTMEIHHGKHHAGYVAKLNVAVEGTDLEGKSLEDLMNVAGSNTAVRNNGGGHWNHSLFWSIMGKGKGGAPEGDLAAAINSAFGSFDKFKDLFSNEAATRFGSGWAWLIVADGKLAVTSTPNQDNPLMDVADVKGTPILGLDVWEHAYYLNYQNRRPDYVEAFFNVIDWNAVAENYKSAQ